MSRRLTEPASLDDIADEVLRIARTDGSVLFAGAGVGCRAGLPDWRTFVLGLADAADSYDPDTADLMRKRVGTGSYLNALELYRICPFMPDGTRLQRLSDPFSTNQYNAKPLRALAALPFNAIVTTNFDRSLHDAFAMARQTSAFAAELDDPSLKQAIYNWKDPFIARIHGRAEIPRTMVLDQTGYSRTELNADYTEFLVHVLTRMQCAFIGYSFVDPAIHRVMQVVEARVAGGFPVEHLAILPSTAAELHERLARYNIRVLTYDAAASHDGLWRSIRFALSRYRDQTPKAPPPFREPLEGAHRLLSASYARSSMSSSAGPLRAVIAEGLALGILVESPGLTRLELAERFRLVLPVTSTEAERIAQPATDRLLLDRIIEERDRQLWVRNTPENRIGHDLDQLARSVADRVRVRFGLEVTETELSCISRILEFLVLSRGWDLAASLASAKRSDLFDLNPALDAALGRFAATLSPVRKDALREAVRNLLDRPGRSEAALLSKLARLSFGVDIALERGRSTFVHGLTLPERIYLDASVLLPAITPGHPYRAGYIAAIRRLQDAANMAGVTSRVLVLESFLNEVVSHRAKAIRLVEDGGLEDPRRLANFIRLNRADYTNVFVGGYSSLVGRSGEAVAFRKYLDEVAPYDSEDALARFLLQQGVETIPSKPTDPRERDDLAMMTTELYAAYEGDRHEMRDPKPEILIRHEAEQLARLVRETASGARSVFVTADSRLRRLAKGEILGRVAPYLFSHTGLLQLVDLLVGLDADDESMSRLLWAVEARDQKDALRGYFIDLALRRYDAAMAMSIPTVVDHVVQDSLEAAKRENIDLALMDTGEDINRLFEFLDRFEDGFFQRMAEEIRRRESGR